MVSASHDQSLRLWDLGGGCIAELVGHTPSAGQQQSALVYRAAGEPKPKPWPLAVSLNLNPGPKPQPLAPAPEGPLHGHLRPLGRSLCELAAALACSLTSPLEFRL